MIVRALALVDDAVQRVQPERGDQGAFELAQALQLTAACSPIRMVIGDVQANSSLDTRYSLIWDRVTVSFLLSVFESTQFISAFGVLHTRLVKDIIRL